MEELSLHILDVAENSIAAGARTITITLTEDVRSDLLRCDITDDGKGMSPEDVFRAPDPFYTSRTTRNVGLGLSLLREAARRANGTMEIRSVPNSGTTVSATFQLSHVDRQPLGDMVGTIMALAANSAEVDILYRHTRNGKSIVIDTKELRHRLGGISMTSPDALSLVRKYLAQEEHSLAT